MEKILLGSPKAGEPIIMIFAEGTILKPKSWSALYNHNAYLPIGDCVLKIKRWQEQGAKIIYCSSRKKKQAQSMAELIKKFGFVGDFLVVREKNEKYKDIVEKIKPDILIEDDCKSIGGSWQMCITNVSTELKQRILSIVVPEFKGIDRLPECLDELKNDQK